MTSVMRFCCYPSWLGLSLRQFRRVQFSAYGIPDKYPEFRQYQRAGRHSGSAQSNCSPSAGNGGCSGGCAVFHGFTVGCNVAQRAKNK